MEKKTKEMRILACLVFVALPVLFCGTLLALAAPAQHPGPLLRLGALVQAGTGQAGEAREYEYTLEVANEGFATFTDGQVLQEGPNCSRAEGLQVTGGTYESVATDGTGLLLRGVTLRPGEVLRVRYRVWAASATPIRLWAGGRGPDGEGCEAAIELAAPVPEEGQ